MSVGSNVSPDVFFAQLDPDTLSTNFTIGDESCSAKQSCSDLSDDGLPENSVLQELFRMDPYPPGIIFTPTNHEEAEDGDGDDSVSVIKEVKVLSHFKRPDGGNQLLKKEDLGEERPRYARYREKQYVCDECDRSFTLKQNIAHHYFMYHHPRLPAYNRPQVEITIKFQCTKCEVSFTDKEKAERHEQKVHKPHPPKVVHKCDRCEKTFTSPFQLTEHIEVVHDNIRKYVCDKCGLAFGRSGGLRRHNLMIHENKLYKCTYEGCDHPGYKCSKALAAHIRSVHTHERPFACDECGRRFVRKNDLRVHLTTHNNDKHFKCTECGARFKRQTYLKKHSQHCEGIPARKHNLRKKKKKARKSKRRKMQRVWKLCGLTALSGGSFLLGSQFNDANPLRRAIAATAVVAPAPLPPMPMSPIEKQDISVSVGPSRASQIMQYGFPGFDNLRTFEDFVLSYDRKTRTAHWVCEHLTPDRLAYDPSIDRSKCQFRPDESMHPYFRSQNEDYRGSGYDRGHLAAAGNHRKTQNSVDQTFLLTNMSPQVGKGFNRDKWNDLEKYSRKVAKKSLNTYILTGPLYLPRMEIDGNMYVKYKVIGKNNVAVPTHFFKVLLYETAPGSFELESFVLPNEVIPDSTELSSFYVPLDMIERSGGFMIFDKVPKGAIKKINGKKISGGFW